jgi:aminoglycoside phosphotransferase (APT) family kinase protein
VDSGTLDLETIVVRASRAAGAPVSDVRPLPGGLSSITLAALLQRPVVVPMVIKVAPPGLEPVRNRDVLRQARVLRVLAHVDGIEVPEVLFTDGAPPPLFGMQLVTGDSFEPVNSNDELPEPAHLDGRALAAARMLARLHALDVTRTAGLENEAPVALEQEIARWERALDTVDDDLRRGHDRCAAALKDTIPCEVPAALLHGDWRLGNMLARGAEITAVIDWEIWSIGDPRVDLSWFLANSVSDDNVFATRKAPGMPNRERLLAAYESERGAPMEDLHWFDALTAFKQTATMGLILKRNRRQPTPDPAIEAHAPQLPDLLEHVVRLLGAHPVHT